MTLLASPLLDLEATQKGQHRAILTILTNSVLTPQDTHVWLCRNEVIAVDLIKRMIIRCTGTIPNPLLHLISDASGPGLTSGQESVRKIFPHGLIIVCPNIGRLLRTRPHLGL